MTTTPKPQPVFRFRTRTGQHLLAEITRIEQLASERLRNGFSYYSVSTGALALLQAALANVTGEMVAAAAVPACAPPPESAPSNPPEDSTR